MQSAYVHLLDKVAEPMQDENANAQEANTLHRDSVQVMIRTVLDDLNEAKRGRQKEMQPGIE